MTFNIDQPEGSLGDPKWYRSRARSISGNAPAREFAAMDNTAWIISSRLIAGLILYTGLGFLVSLWLGNRSLFMALGALTGLGLSYYLIFTGLARENREQQDAEHRKTKAKREGDH
jgi:F0F1-type ATP synthase assembly protein I